MAWTLSAMPGALCTVRFTGKLQSSGAVWLDGVQLQNGDLTGFQPRTRGEVGYLCDVPGHDLGKSH